MKKILLVLLLLCSFAFWGGTQIKAKEGTVNLVNAYASSSENGSFIPANAIDGNTGTRWSSAFSDQESLTVELETTSSINSVSILWEAAYASAYELQSSVDGNSWQVIYSTSNGKGATETISVSTQAKFIRMQGLGRALPYGYSIYEIEVYAQAEEASATSSSNESDGYNAQNAIDGNNETRWSSAFSDNENLTIDFKTAISFNQVNINWEAAYASAYQLLTSNDGSNWSIIYSTNNGQGGNEAISVDQTTARYLRMQGVKRALVYGYSIWEISVSSNGSGTADPSSPGTSTGTTPQEQGSSNINIAQGKDAYASSNERGNGNLGVEPSSEGLKVNYLTDGNSSTFIVSNYNDSNPWFYVNLGNTYDINKVSVLFGSTFESPNVNHNGLTGTCYPNSYNILTSIDGTNWTLVKSESGASGKIDSKFAPTTAKYVKIEVTSNNTFALLYELEVFETNYNSNEEEQSMNVLFIGNSHTYTNDVPGIVNSLFDLYTNTDLSYKEITVGGRPLQDHYTTQSTLNEIATNKYDYIILQEKASNWNTALFNTGFYNLYNYIKANAPKAQIVLYMIWSNESVPSVQTEIANAYNNAARDTNSLIAAAGVAWDDIRHNHTDIQLYVDGNHATPFGSYLAASTIFYCLTGRTTALSVNNDSLISRLGISNERANLVQEIVARVVASKYNCPNLLQ